MEARVEAGRAVAARMVLLGAPSAELWRPERRAQRPGSSTAAALWCPLSREPAAAAWAVRPSFFKLVPPAHLACIGGDGYCGWATALHLSARGYKVRCAALRCFCCCSCQA